MPDTRVIAVTGATGFLGRHLVAALGEGVRVLARGEAPPGVEVVRGDLADGPALARLVEGAGVVVHAAGRIKARSAGEFMAANRDGTRRLAEAVRSRAPAARLIVISSLAAREPGLSPYAASKRAGEAAAIAAFAGAGDRLVILRPPAIYGPGDRGMLPVFRLAARPIVPLFGAGRVAMIHAGDAAAAVARLAAGLGQGGLCAVSDPNPAGYTIGELLREAASALGHGPRFVRLPDAVLLAAGAASQGWGRVCGRIPLFTLGKAREMLHPDWSVAPEEALPEPVYRPRIALAQGFRETAAWYRAAGWIR